MKVKVGKEVVKIPKGISGFHNVKKYIKKTKKTGSFKVLKGK